MCCKLIACCPFKNRNLFFIACLLLCWLLLSGEAQSQKRETLPEEKRVVKESKKSMVKSRRRSPNVRAKRFKRKGRVPAESQTHLSGYRCVESFKDKYTEGHIEVGMSDLFDGDEISLGFFHIQRNRCERDVALGKDFLIRYFCDPQREGRYSSKKILCAKGCQTSRSSGYCIQ